MDLPFLFNGGGIKLSAVRHAPDDAGERTTGERDRYGLRVARAGEAGMGFAG